MSNNKTPSITFNNHVAIPQIGLGVWQAKNGKEVENAVASAISEGYRLIDTAAAYGNEEGVGQAMSLSGVARSELFVTSKLWNDSHSYDKALRAFDKSLELLGLDYMDMYLIHWPVPADNKYPEAWRALERLYDEKRVRAIGISNFKTHHIKTLLKDAYVVPALNQIELHPRLQQKETREFCAEHNIAIESWSPIMRGGELLNDPELIDIATKHKKTAAQVIIRWHVQNGFIVIPKSVHANRIAQNIDVFDFELNEIDMQTIDAMDNNERTGPDPDEANFK